MTVCVDEHSWMSTIHCKFGTSCYRKRIMEDPAHCIRCLDLMVGRPPILTMRVHDCKSSTSLRFVLTDQNGSLDVCKANGTRHFSLDLAKCLHGSAAVVSTSTRLFWLRDQDRHVRAGLLDQETSHACEPRPCDIGESAGRGIEGQSIECPEILPRLRPPVLQPSPCVVL
jgi:hypothetical protein